jgi:hypothetical protein
MAHFAQLDENNIVIQVIVVNNSELTDENGDEQESLGVAFCQNLFGADTIWKQTSYSTYGGQRLDVANVWDPISGDEGFRKNYAEKGWRYDPTLDAFCEPVQPYPSWTFSTTTCTYQPPIPKPEITISHGYVWDEDLYQSDTSDPKTLGWVVS